MSTPPLYPTPSPTKARIRTPLARVRGLGSAKDGTAHFWDTHEDMVFAKVNTEEEQELAGYFQIRSIPTLMVFREKIIVFSQPGAMPGSALEEVIAKAKTLDMDQIRAEIAAEEKTQA